MGIIQRFSDFFYRYNNQCRGCGKPLVGLQEYACSDECTTKAEWSDAVR